MIHNYKLNFNEDGYIESGYVTDTDYNFTGQLSDYPDVTDGWCKLIDGKIVVDEQKKAEIQEEEAKQIEIADLKEKLNETDYIMARMLEEIMALNNPLTFIVDIIKIFANYASKYKDALDNRKAWRTRIEELEQ